MKTRLLILLPIYGILILSWVLKYTTYPGWAFSTLVAYSGLALWYFGQGVATIIKNKKFDFSGYFNLLLSLTATVLGFKYLHYPFSDYYAPLVVILLVGSTLYLIIGKNNWFPLSGFEKLNGLLFILLLIPTFLTFNGAPRPMILDEWLGESFDYPAKRNTNWSWVVMDGAEKGKWLHRGNGKMIESGQFTNFYSTGQVYESGRIKNYERNDSCFFFDTAGTIIQILVYGEGDPDQYFPINGPFERHYDNGELFQKGRVENHQRSADWKEFYSNGNIKYNFYTKVDSSVQEQYFMSGQLSDIATYYSDKLTGIRRTYYENGKLRQLVKYHRGNLVGPSLHWYENGQLKQQLNYQNGDLQGEAREWYENGQTQFIGSYLDGKKEGPWLVYYEDGSPKQHCVYVRGRAHGKVTTHDEDGSLHIDFFEHGKKVESLDDYKAIEPPKE
ncbi:toxin-antitoxin system YwqK family antitoxin [bacterium SCSIO 12741]|nr:toxin-antitoxin system YwqK family antitoxin [bacterium SCSIO 12741]